MKIQDPFPSQWLVFEHRIVTSIFMTLVLWVLVLHNLSFSITALRPSTYHCTRHVADSGTGHNISAQITSATLLQNAVG